MFPISRIARSAALGLALAAASAGAFVQAPTRIKFTLDWRFEGQTSFVWLGLAKGYFQQEGVDLQVDAGSGSAAAVSRIATGAYDGGLGDLSSLIEYIGNNPGQTRMQMVYVLYDEAPLAYYALKKSGIKSIADLAGKPVTGAPFEITRKLWPMFAKAAKVDAGSVKWTNVDPALRTNAVIKGDVIAAGGFYNIPLEFEARGVKREDLTELRVSELGVRVYGNGVMFSSKMINENPKAVAGFVRAFNRSFREGLADPAESVRYLKAREPIVDEKLEVSRFTMLFPAMLTERTRSAGLGAINKLVLENQVDEVTTSFNLKTKPNADLIFNSSFLPSRGDRLPLK